MFGAGATAAPVGLADADALAAEHPSPARDRALKRWAEERAGLSDLLYLLRRPASDLGPAEAALVEAALRRTSIARPALRRRLLARLELVDPRSRARERETIAAGGPVRHPRASVFRVSALLPDSGDYQSYSRSLLEGIRAGLRPSGARAALPIELDVRSSGDDDPGRVVTAFDSVAEGSGAVIGELLSVPTLVLATAARYAGLPLLSPTATDEGIGALSRAAFQIGPSGYERGMRLAHAVLGDSALRVGVLVSSVAEHGSLALGFATTAERIGSPVVWRDAYAPGSANFRDDARALQVNRVELLFWDGDPREAEALMRQLARDHVSVRLCGGEGLAPGQHHAETRVLLEGVRYVGDEWELEPAVSARLDSLLARESGERAGSLEVRGFLAGRMLSAAVASGALCPEEVADFLASHAATDPILRARGFLDLYGEGATLPVFTARKGRGVVE